MAEIKFEVVKEWQGTSGRYRLLGIKNRKKNDYTAYILEEWKLGNLGEDVWNPSTSIKGSSLAAIIDLCTA